ncbi:MAG: hypothetical protein ABW321_36040 [Polyangiales bacterium]
MTTRTGLWNLIGLAMLVSASSAHAASPEPACVFDQYAPTAARPWFSVDENVVPIAFGPDNFFRGAELYVPAREGLTREWLTAITESALTSGTGPETNGSASALTCGPKIKNVKVNVVSAGGGFWVQLITRDEASAGSVLRWAQGVVDQHKRVKRGHVTVQPSP